jgi:rhombotail lipoprotein
MRIGVVLGLIITGWLLSGCTDLGCTPLCHSHTQNSSSLVEFLYPNGKTPPLHDAVPQLRVPLRVGLSFLPSNGGEALMGLDAGHKEELLERIKQRFLSRHFVADIVVIPDYYLTGRRGFEGLESVQRLYGLDLLALVSYDQINHLDDNSWSLGYLTIVGAYVLKGSRHDVSTLVDLAVVDPVTRSLVLRAGGTDTRHGSTTLIDSARETRQAAVEGFSAATDQMIEHFDASLTEFEADVRSGKAAVSVVRKDSASRPGGGGALGGTTILALLMLVMIRGFMRLETVAR